MDLSRLNEPLAMEEHLSAVLDRQSSESQFKRLVVLVLTYLAVIPLGSAATTHLMPHLTKAALFGERASDNHRGCIGCGDAKRFTPSTLRVTISNRR